MAPIPINAPLPIRHPCIIALCQGTDIIIQQQRKPIVCMTGGFIPSIAAFAGDDWSDIAS
ncbi:hypothetical protein D3C76_1775100 [compost metagenome]